MQKNNVHGMQYENQSNNAYYDGSIKDQCKRYMQHHVIGQMGDGSQIEGIITDINEDYVEMLVPEEYEEQENRQFGYGYDDYDDYNGYGGYRRRYRRYRPRRFPYYFFRRLFRYPYYY